MEKLDLAQFEGAVYDEAKVKEYLERYAEDLADVADENKEDYAKTFEQIMIELANNREEYARCEKMPELIFDVYKKCEEKGDVKEFMSKAKKAWMPKFMMLPFQKRAVVHGAPSMEAFIINSIVRKMNGRSMPENWLKAKKTEE